MWSFISKQSAVAEEFGRDGGWQCARLPRRNGKGPRRAVASVFPPALTDKVGRSGALEEVCCTSLKGCLVPFT